MRRAYQGFICLASLKSCALNAVKGKWCQKKMVDVARFELATPAMSMQCSTAELYVLVRPPRLASLMILDKPKLILCLSLL
jgi:hypothetical protein